jgi:hypothetical protein
VGGGFGWNISGPLPPVAQYVGICLDVKDDFGVERPTFENPQVKEKRDVTRFLFGIVDPHTQQAFLVQTFEFNISGGANSNLVKFLRAWTNSDPYGFDYLTLKGQGAMITVGHKQSAKTPGIVYATIAGISPVYPTLQNQIPNPAMFAQLVAAANQPRQQTVGGQAVAGPAGVRKFWVTGQGGQVVSATQEQILAKGNPQLMIMTEDQRSGWVPAHQLMQFPIAAAAPPPPLGASVPPVGFVPPPPPAASAAPSAWGTPPAAGPLPTAQDDEIPF